jgi:hypothetical protein
MEWYRKANPVNLLRGLVRPISVGGLTDHLDRRKPLGRIRGGIAQRRQLAHGHQKPIRVWPLCFF